MPADDVHEWISFEDPVEDRTLLIDATFLLSNWSCIYGAGCLGVLDHPAPELQHGCCTHGAHLVDDDDLDDLQAAAACLTDDDWQFRSRSKRYGIVRREPDGTPVTRIIDGACIFLNRPGFAAGSGCALHLAAVNRGERPLDWKPDVCWQLPLRLNDDVDDNGHVTSTLREWKRRDWGGGGREFHWWCTESPEAFAGSIPVYEYLRDEIVELIGEEAYAVAVELLHRRSGRVTPLPHPAVRR